MKHRRTEVDPIDALRAFVGRYQTQKEAAEELGISQAYMHDLLTSARDLSPRLLGKLGLRRAVVEA